MDESRDFAHARVARIGVSYFPAQHEGKEKSNNARKRRKKQVSSQDIGLLNLLIIVVRVGMPPRQSDAISQMLAERHHCVCLSLSS